MDDSSKKSLRNLLWTLLITAINGLITIFNPATEEVASLFLNKFFC